MNDVIDISATIIPKSDQLNADQLLAGDLTIAVSRVSASGSDDQPVSIYYEGDKGRPYKPCKTMRKLLAYAWGSNAAAWVGRAMTLFHEPDVKFGGELVGGIRISHLSDIPADIKVSLTTTRGKKALTSVKRMERPASADHVGLIKAASDVAELKAAFEAAWASTKDKPKRAEYKAAYDAKKAALTSPPDDPAPVDDIDEQPQFTVNDAMSMIRDGDYDSALQVAEQLGGNDAIEIQNAVGKAKKEAGTA